MSTFKAIHYEEGLLSLIDQRKIPLEKTYFMCNTLDDVIFAIKDMVVRGAPAIGATAAYGMVIGARELHAKEVSELLESLVAIKKKLDDSRPTAVNLMWATSRMLSAAQGRTYNDTEEIVLTLEKEAHAIYNEDAAASQSMANFGNTLIPHGAKILTHCNTGALATVALGTALGVIRQAHLSGKNIHVFADETRPRLQGAKLTAWELVEEGIPATLIPDSVAATLIRDRKVDLVIVGADRITSNGDTANKIGTFMLSVLAKVYGIPFYIAAPLSTVDFNKVSGAEIDIEERDDTEVTHINGFRIAPEGIEVFNPAFDVTPHENITAIITEKGIAYPPFDINLQLMNR